jgi:hypothetical protein
MKTTWFDFGAKAHSRASLSPGALIESDAEKSSTVAGEPVVAVM